MVRTHLLTSMLGCCGRLLPPNAHVRTVQRTFPVPKQVSGQVPSRSPAMQQEGIITYRLEFVKAPPRPAAELGEIERWRQRLRAAGVLGQDPLRYDGFGFGNISRRLEPMAGPPEARSFLITGTQTGAIPRLTGRHYAVVRECHAAENRVVAEGPVPPSSESLTHGMLYALDDSLRWVMHVHAPWLWQNATLLRLPVTHPDAPQGTPAMSAEVQRLFAQTNVRNTRIFAMGGHQDGLVSFGSTADEAGNAILSRLSL